MITKLIYQINKLNYHWYK